MESKASVQPPLSVESEQTTLKKPVSRPQHRALTIAAIVTGIVLVAVGSFAFGFSVGLHKARFSYRFGENYERNFMKADREEMKDRVMKKMDGKLFRSGHGVAGQILSIAEGSIIVSGPEGQENSVIVSDTTVIMKGGEKVSLADLSTSERIVVLGKPTDNGSIQADLIRVFDAKENRSDGPLRRLFR